MGRYYIPPENNHFAAQHRLTQRELDILRLIVKGKFYKEISKELSGMSIEVVRNYAKSILRKTGASNMIQVAVLFTIDELQHTFEDVSSVDCAGH